MLKSGVVEPETRGVVNVAIEGGAVPEAFERGKVDTVGSEEMYDSLLVVVVVAVGGGSYQKSV
jgi:hypothetical protein